MTGNPRRSFKTLTNPSFAACQPTSSHDGYPEPSTFTELPLRKSATFHSPKTPPSIEDPILNIRLLSRRSPTSHKDLENVVAINEQRLSQFLGSVDRSLAGQESFSTDSQETLKQEEAPVPRFMLESNFDNPNRMDVDSPSNKPAPKPQQPTHNRHSSDSGLGSSISSAEDSFLDDQTGERAKTYSDTLRSSVSEIRSGINGANADYVTRTQHMLSKYACKQIQDHLILPILEEKQLAPFHNLIKSIPFRVSRKEITCLRDLEKVILLLAPRYCGSSGSSFLRFGETSIQCLHTTADHLNDVDQRRPSDRPYTNGYFLDLTEQIRQYAAMINEARERLANGQAGEEHGYVPGERLSLYGGLGQTGRPAELVRMKDGQTISLRTGQAVDPNTYSTPSDEDKDLQVSMARRKKSEQAAAKQAQRCSECDKEFKRPCDLTKHEKTHSRPWKCNEPSCKYSQYGWPTEKERDRHVNDKHTMTPNMYKCKFHPCPYESKRESNCKQHMEKAHGWAYVRSKNNGKASKKTVKIGKSRTPPTPQTNPSSTPGSNIFDNGSDFGEPTSPYMPINSFNNTGISDSTRSSVSPYMANGILPPSTGYGSTSASPYLGTDNGYSPFNSSYGWNDSFARLTPQTSHTPSSHRQSIDSTNLPNFPSIDMRSDDPTLFDWSNLDLTSMNMNIHLDPAPLSSASTRPLDTYTVQNPSISVNDIKNPNLSPNAQGNEMLYTPYSQDDEGYSDFSNNNMAKPSGDFALFDDDRPASSMSTANLPLFAELPDLPPFQPTNWSGQALDSNGDDLQMQEN